MHLRDSLLLAEKATASGCSGGAGPRDVSGSAGADTAKAAAALEVAATLEANRKLAVINGMGDHNRAQVPVCSLQQLVQSNTLAPATSCKNGFAACNLQLALSGEFDGEQ